MNKYELMFIISTETSDEQKENVIEKVKSIIVENGSVEKVDKWGVKKFAYPINFKNEGYYVVVNFESIPGVIVELDRKLTLMEEVVRQMIIKND